MDVGSLFSVAGRTALVTGGSRGIGEMIARGLSAGGARVVLAARNGAAAEAVAADLPDARAVAADLSTLDGVRQLTDDVRTSEKRLDILVNNAGASWGESLAEFTETGWDKVMDLNVKSLFFLTQQLAPMLEASASADRRARIINVASIDGMRVPEFESYSYSASKAAVIHLTKVLARRLVGNNVNVNAIAPGLFPSKMTAFMFDQMEDAVVGSIPMRRAGRPEDMAGAALFLASPASEYVTGHTLVVDGGIVGTN